MQPRFSIRALMCVVMVCALGLAIYRKLPKPELLPGIRYGASQRDMLRKFGEPEKQTFNSNKTENWIYYKSRNVRDSKGRVITLNEQPSLEKWSWPKYGYEKYLVITLQGDRVISAVIVEGWQGQPTEHARMLYPDLTF